MDDGHLCHLTNVPSIKLHVYDPCAAPRWRDFDPSMPIEWPGDVPILVRQATLRDDECVGVKYFIEKVMDAVSTSREIREYAVRVVGE